MKVGEKIKFEGERNKYTVQACDDRYIIATKPFNAQKTVLYTIVDLERKVRGRDNLIFGHGYGSREGCEENLKRLQNNEMEVSYRYYKELEPEELQTLTTPK